MSEEEFERPDYEEVEEGQSGSEFQGAENDLRVNPYCGTGDCTNDEEDPAETAWIKLMSAVPQATQINSMTAAREGTMLLPPGQTIQSMVASLRPQPEADYALDTIRDKWSEFHELFGTIWEDLENGLADLANSWKGDDYDGFEEQTQTVIRNCKTIMKDIAGEDGAGGIIKVLNDKQQEIFNQQGGTAIVYPAPKFFLENTGCGSQAIHIRPPFFQTCEIKANDETKEAVELAGFDPGIVDEVHDAREEEYNRWAEYVAENPDYEEDGRKGEELAQYKADQLADDMLEDMGNDGQEILQAQAAEVNEEVTDRHSTTDMAVTEIEPDHEQGEQTTFNDGQTDKPGSGGLDSGGGGGMPDMGGGGLDGMEPPAPGSVPTPDLGGGPNSPRPDLPGPGGPPDTNLPDDGLDPNPWDPSTPDPDDVGGGLASGGGGGGGLGGLPGGGGAGGGLPGGGAGGGLGAGAGGIGGGMMGGAGAGRGAGAGAGGRGAGAGAGAGRGAGAGAGGRGAGAGAGRGMAGGMMGGAGGRGMGGPGEDQDGKDTWLTEEDDVWGIGNEDEDPYA
ncbi:hypothetical protein [Glycomyces tenuis]|uniref:hypothetical protein n=1 Tax=Glycomyces tenuis TaxID=58116 RepID=UPI0004100B79|nr:hypothetical protein [Glycomyces tenuis]